MVDLSVLGISVREADRIPLLLLHPQGAGKIVCLRVSPVEALAVSMALAYSSPTEPSRSGFDEDVVSLVGPGVFHGLLSHELMARLVESLGGRLLAVELPRMTDGDFLAELVLKTVTGLARLDCRPADAIALALRCGAVIRMPDHLLVHAEDMDAVMASLPEHVRAVIAAGASGRSGTAGFVEDGLTLPSEVEAALAFRRSSPDAEPHRNIINAAKKILEQQGLRGDLEKLLSSVNTIAAGQAGSGRGPEQAVQLKKQRLPKVEIKLVSINRVSGVADKLSGGEADGPGNGDGDSRSGVASRHVAGEGGQVKEPRIRVSLVRQSGKGEAEVVEEFQLPGVGIPKDVLAGLGLSRSEAEALGREVSEEERWAMLLRMLSPETKVAM